MAQRSLGKHSVLAHADASLPEPQRGDMVVISPTGEPEAPDPNLEKPLTDAGDLSDTDELEIEEVEDQIRKALDELDESEGRACIRIFRIGPGGARDQSFCDEISPSEYSYKFLADNFGGGSYYVKLYVPKYDQHGTNLGVRMRVNKRVRVEGLPKTLKREADAPAPASGASDLLALGKIMADGFQQIGRMIAENRPREKSTMDFARELAAIKSLFVDANAKSGPDPIDMLEKFASIASQLRPPGDGDSGVMGEMVRLFGPVVRDAVANKNSGAPAPAAPATPALAEIPDVNGDASDELDFTQGKLDDMNPTDLIYKGYAMLLVRHARSNNPTEPIAQQILDEAPEQFIEWLIQIAPADVIPLLAKYDKAVSLFPEWFKRLHADIVRLDKASDDNAA